MTMAFAQQTAPAEDRSNNWRAVLGTIKDGDPIYVMNTTGAKTTGEVGNIVFSVYDGQQRRDIVVPKTVQAPIDLTIRCRTSALRDAPEFRELLELGVLVLIPAANAEAALGTVSARAELKRVRDRLNKTAPNAGSNSSNMTEAEIEAAAEKQDTIAMDMFNRLKQGEFTEERAIKAMRGLDAAGELSDDDLNLMLNVKGSDGLTKALMEISEARSRK